MKNAIKIFIIAALFAVVMSAVGCDALNQLQQNPKNPSAYLSNEYVSVSADATERGIGFTVKFLKESNWYEIMIENADGDIQLYKLSEKEDSAYLEYPFVTAGKNYNFSIKIYHSENSSFNAEEEIIFDNRLNINAIAGIGELKVENKDSLSVEISDGNVVSLKGVPSLSNTNSLIHYNGNIFYTLRRVFSSKKDVIVDVLETDSVWEIPSSTINEIKYFIYKLTAKLIIKVDGYNQYSYFMKVAEKTGFWDNYELDVKAEEIAFFDFEDELFKVHSLAPKPDGAVIDIAENEGIAGSNCIKVKQESLVGIVLFGLTDVYSKGKSYYIEAMLRDARTPLSVNQGVSVASFDGLICDQDILNIAEAHGAQDYTWWEYDWEPSHPGPWDLPVYDYPLEYGKVLETYLLDEDGDLDYADPYFVDLSTSDWTKVNGIIRSEDIEYIVSAGNPDDLIELNCVLSVFNAYVDNVRFVELYSDIPEETD